MRHKLDHRKLGRTSEHRRALLRNMATSLFRHDRIETTLEKAKELRRYAEKLITLAKKDTLHARRTAATKISDPEVLQKLFGTLGPLYANRPGGYTRIVKLGARRGDNAEKAFIELVGREPKFETAAPKAKKGAKAPAKGEKAGETAPEAAAEKPAKKAAPKSKAKPKAAAADAPKKPRAKKTAAAPEAE